MSLLLLCTQSLVVDEFFDPFQTLNLIGNVEGLKDVWEGCVITTHPLYGRLQIKEALGLQHKAETLLIQVNLANNAQRNDANFSQPPLLPLPGPPICVYTYILTFFYSTKVEEQLLSRCDSMHDKCISLRNGKSSINNDLY